MSNANPRSNTRSPLATTPTKKPLDSVHLQLIGNGSPDQFVGVRAVPGRLPELLRYPGESAGALCKRALHLVTGPGALVAWLIYHSETPRQ
jgi:hypothetical protein